MKKLLHVQYIPCHKVFQCRPCKVSTVSISMLIFSPHTSRGYVISVGVYIYVCMYVCMYVCICYVC